MATDSTSSSQGGSAAAGHAASTPTSVPTPPSSGGAYPSINGQHPIASPNGHTDYSSLATALEPALVHACDGDLSNIEWFRSTWQSGGAATARAKFSLTNGRLADVIVKLPVGPAEYRWTTGMEGLDAPDGAHCELEHGCTPRVFAAGLELGGYDLAWLVVERLSGHPLSHGFDAASAEQMLVAAVDWYARAGNLRPITLGDRPPKKDWGALLGRAASVLEDDDVIADEDRWRAVVSRTRQLLPKLVEIWESRPFNTWCHGDLHPGNVMRREGSNGAGNEYSNGSANGSANGHLHGGGGGGGGAPCVLIDLALVHAGHWVEDAVYLERLYWGRPELLHDVKPVPVVARVLRERGMLGNENYELLANVRRVLMGASAPAFLAKEGNPRYVHAALEIVEHVLPILGE